jgi:hypothetical protein
MGGDPLVAHSLAEVYLYLMAMHCSGCDSGPVEGTEPRPDGSTEELQLLLAARCTACGREQRLRFSLPHGTGKDPSKPDAVPVVNPTSEPSRIIDVAQWLTLFRSLAEAASRLPNPQEMRRVGIEAAQCLEEALKFYEPDNDLPPGDALYTAASRRRLREHPQEFSRQRLVELRSRLPGMRLMRRRAEEAKAPRRRWWQLWR